MYWYENWPYFDCGNVEGGIQSVDSGKGLLSSNGVRIIIPGFGIGCQSLQSMH